MSVITNASSIVVGNLPYVTIESENSKKISVSLTNPGRVEITYLSAGMVNTTPKLEQQVSVVLNCPTLKANGGNSCSAVITVKQVPLSANSQLEIKDSSSKVVRTAFCCGLIK